MQTIGQINYDGRLWTITVLELDPRGYQVAQPTALKYDAKQGAFVDGFRQPRLTVPPEAAALMSQTAAALEACLADGGGMAAPVVERERIAISDGALALEAAKKAEAEAAAAKRAAESALARLADESKR